MANIKSAKKRNRQNVGRTARNRITRSNLRNAVKKLHSSVQSGEGTQESLREVHSVLSKAATKGVLHKKTASRRTSRLAKQVNRAAAATS
ncbi:MAG: 30S ribosomal protein S20 [Nitrospinaceae bacterium]|nr:30S ribosomal protein S20 [Nitrospinaceae bacterium]MBT3433176.1 30S ribosomal protein S20 [Nitrospinaceae bacterium]MBT4093121.1 30S ribosomal protein S20 [Nitrospinaceae bacterium]MBT5369176.1 30S ribosomal protein S20 [Nitrospinaceae bacterium]MBT5947049.1 30S ribosomal protein S20 [Nitrospinaceae bacterium]